MKIPIPRFLSLVIIPISRVLWRNLKKKVRGSGFLFRVKKGGGEEEVFKMT